MAYCTLADVIAYLQSDGVDAPRDALINAILPRTTAFIDGYCNTPAGWAKETDRKDTVEAIIDRHGNLCMLLPKPHVKAVSAINVMLPVGDVVASLSRTWLPLSDHSPLRLMDGAWLGYRNWPLRCEVTYTAGYDLPPAEGEPTPDDYNPLPADLVHSAAVLTARVMKSAQAGFSDVVGADQFGQAVYAKAMPREIQTILNDYRRVVA